jgi:hypothetical protein
MPNRTPLMAGTVRVRSAPPALLLALLALAACRPGLDTAQGTAERFVDAHYVNINLAEAKPFCVGPALTKIEDEQRLTTGQVIDESTRKPRVGYTLLEKRAEGSDRASFLFEGTIRVADADPFTRKWMITTRKDASGWRVSNYDESE